MNISKVTYTSLVLTLVLLVSLVPGFTIPIEAQKQQVTLTADSSRTKRKMGYFV